MMKFAPLANLRIVEGSAFVAAPLGGLLLAQLGAEVIRFDQIDGGLDYKRWPLSKESKSLFWTGLNRGKKSIQVDLKQEAGRKIISDLITAPGEDAGIFITNLPARDELSYESLRKNRPDLIMVSLSGNFDGSNEVDYTVHPSFGYPMITGEKGSTLPVNSVLPTWDLLLGHTVAIAIMAAERTRRITGEGDFIKIALSDIALATIGALGRLSQAYLGSEDVKPDGNFLYGSFGKNFKTADKFQIMLVGLTDKQWNNLKKALNVEDQLAVIENQLNTNLNLEGERYKYRYQIADIVSKVISTKKLSDITKTFNDNNVSWSKYQTFQELLENDERASFKNPIFNLIEQPGIGILPNIALPIRFQNNLNLDVENAPELGANTFEILKSILHKSDEDINRLLLNKTVA